MSNKATPIMSGLQQQLKLSTEVIEAQVKTILTIRENRLSQYNKQLEADCEKSFKIAADLVMGAKDDFVYSRIPTIPFMKTDCTQFAEFKNIMAEHGIKVLEPKHYANSVSYQITEKERTILFS